MGSSRGLLLLLCGVVVAIVLSANSLRTPDRGEAQVTGIAGPIATATLVDARTIPLGGGHLGPGHQRRHPGGEAELDAAKTGAGAIGAPPVQSQTSGASSVEAIGGLGFDGIDDVESGCGCLPPDGAIAVGPTRIVGAVNTAFKVWDKNGTLLPGFPKSLSNLLSSPNCLAKISDPFAEYDATSDRFMLGALTYDTSNNSSVCVAVTTTADPASTWHVYGFGVTTAHDLFDFPHATIGSNAIYVSGNQFQNGSTFSGARLYAYDKAKMYAGQPAGSAFVDVGNNAAGKVADTLTPVRGVPVANTGYFIAADNAVCSCSSISLWRWSDPFGLSSLTLRGGVSVTPYAQPPNAAQPGHHVGTIATNDAGNLGAYWSSGTVYGVHTVGVDPGLGTVAAVQWYQLANPDGVPSLAQQGVIAQDGEYRFFPNLSVDNSGNMTFAYAYSSSADFAGIRFTGRLASDPPGVLEAESVLKAGEQSVNGSRYGDYAGEALDPDGCAVWHFEEYARAGSLWGTWAGSIRQATCGASGTATATATATATNTRTATATSTLVATATATPTATMTITDTPTDTPSPTATDTATPTETATPTPCTIRAADLNNDGVVNGLDLAILAPWFLQTSPPAPSQVDINKDGKVNALDLAVLASVFTQSVAACP